MNRITEYICNEQEYILFDTILEILTENKALYLYWSGQEEEEKDESV